MVYLLTDLVEIKVLNRT